MKEVVYSVVTKALTDDPNYMPPQLACSEYLLDQEGGPYQEPLVLKLLSLTIDIPVCAHVPHTCTVNRTYIPALPVQCTVHCTEYSCTHVNMYRVVLIM